MADSERPRGKYRDEMDAERAAGRVAERAEFRAESDKLEQERIEKRVKLFCSWGWTEANARQYIELDGKNFMLVWNLQYASVLSSDDIKKTARHVIHNHAGMVEIEENYNQNRPSTEPGRVTTHALSRESSG